MEVDLQEKMVSGSDPLVNNNNYVSKENIQDEGDSDKNQPPMEIVWSNVLGFLVLHCLGFLGMYQLFVRAQFLTFAYLLTFLLYIGILGVTGGAHRFWTHRSFRATMPFKILLMIAQTLSSQNCIWIWARDHRLHHRYTDTDADPHNARRGFFFSHMGWLMVRKHPDVKLKGPSIDMSDLDADPVVMFQKKYYYPLYALLALIPPLAPWYFWGEDLYTSFLTMYFARLFISLHATWSVNSWAHKYGSRPFSKQLLASETFFVSVLSLGEGWHNYHHTFPWDYKASEHGKFNWTTDVLNFFAALGMAFDLKSATKEMIEHRVNKYGDGSREIEYDELIEDMKLTSNSNGTN